MHKPQEELYELEHIKLRRFIPLLHLWRIPGMALEPRKICLCFLALLIIDTGISIVPGITGQSVEYSTRLNTDSTGSTLGYLHIRQYHRMAFAPLQQTLLPSTYQPKNSERKFLCMIIAYITWTIAGLMVCTIASQEFVTDRPGSLTSSFTTLKYYRYEMWYPLFFGGCLLVLLLGLKTSSGLQAMLWTPLGLVFGLLSLVMALCFVLLMAGTILSWPLSLVAITTEQTDGFEAMSRGLSYVLNRFGYFLLAGLLSTILITPAMYIISHLLSLAYVFGFELWGLNSGSSFTRSYLVTHQAIISLLPEAGLLSENPVSQYALGGIKLLLTATGASLFWCTTTVIYFLLRHAEDGTPLDKICRIEDINGDASDEQGVPLVGLAERARTIQEEQAANKDQD